MPLRCLTRRMPAATLRALWCSWYATVAWSWSSVSGVLKCCRCRNVRTSIAKLSSSFNKVNPCRRSPRCESISSNECVPRATLPTLPLLLSEKNRLGGGEGERREERRGEERNVKRVVILFSENTLFKNLLPSSQLCQLRLVACVLCGAHYGGSDVHHLCCVQCDGSRLDVACVRSTTATTLVENILCVVRVVVAKLCVHIHHRQAPLDAEVDATATV